MHARTASRIMLPALLCLGLALALAAILLPEATPLHEDVAAPPGQPPAEPAPGTSSPSANSPAVVRLHSAPVREEPAGVAPPPPRASAVDDPRVPFRATARPHVEPAAPQPAPTPVDEVQDASGDTEARVTRLAHDPERVNEEVEEVPTEPAPPAPPVLPAAPAVPPVTDPRSTLPVAGIPSATVPAL